MAGTAAKNLLFNQMSEKLRKTRKILDEIRGERDIHKKKYVSLSRLSELEGLNYDVINCSDALQHSYIKHALPKINKSIKK